MVHRQAPLTAFRPLVKSMWHIRFRNLQVHIILLAIIHLNHPYVCHASFCLENVIFSR